ncbi:hypothetical protein FB45DRAFT_1026205 [Roridomyces roridus]|uniref:Uncharacterized protein n=1 Tax=Roridomyces roridus TaxID=1738132 RepID=A0AAD7FPD9_9AGAR|nr:hypothetical protein FB45DRAFT_1026205 [Roridomyces roridus]
MDVINDVDLARQCILEAHRLVFDPCPPSSTPNGTLRSRLSWTDEITEPVSHQGSTTRDILHPELRHDGRANELLNAGIAIRVVPTSALRRLGCLTPSERFHSSSIATSFAILPPAYLKGCQDACEKLQRSHSLPLGVTAAYVSTFKWSRLHIPHTPTFALPVPLLDVLMLLSIALLMLPITGSDGVAGCVVEEAVSYQRRDSTSRRASVSSGSRVDAALWAAAASIAVVSSFLLFSVGLGDLKSASASGGHSSRRLAGVPMGGEAQRRVHELDP